MKNKLSSLYCTFVPCKSFVSNFFIVEKTFAFYEKKIFSEEKTFAIFCFTISKAETFAKIAKVSASKATLFCIITYLVRKVDDSIF